MTTYEPSGIGGSARERRVRHKARRGFSIVELIVVILVIAFLIALLLPAVEAPREAAGGRSA